MGRRQAGLLGVVRTASSSNVSRRGATTLLMTQLLGYAGVPRHWTHLNFHLAGTA